MKKNQLDNYLRVVHNNVPADPAHCQQHVVRRGAQHRHAVQPPRDVHGEHDGPQVPPVAVLLGPVDGLPQLARLLSPVVHFVGLDVLEPLRVEVVVRDEPDVCV